MPEVSVPIFGRFVTADPDKNAPRVEYARLSEALTQHRRTDRFLCQYSNPEHPYRLSRQGVTPPRMVIVAFDVDDTEAKAARTAARDEWRIRERAKIAALVADTACFAYETKGGYRAVLELPAPFVITRTEHEDEWTARYKSWCNYLERVYQITADRACADWTRIFRLPHATRDPDEGPEFRPTYGPAHDPGVWEPELAPEDVVSPDIGRANKPDLSAGEMTHPTPLGVRVDHAITYAENLPPAISKQGGHNTLLAAANTIYKGFALPRDVAFNILEDVYNPRCEPPWKAKELDHKLTAVERSSEPVGEIIDAIELSAEAERTCPRRREPADPEEDSEPLSTTTGQGSELSTVGWQGNFGRANEGLIGAPDPLPTGIATIDRITDGGLRAGEPFVIGGAPNAGKTTLALSIAFAWAQQGKHVAVAAFDEPKKRIVPRLGQFLGFDRKGLARGGTAEERAQMDALPIRAYDGRKEGMSIEWIAEKLGEHGPGVLVIDSLQMCVSKAVTERMNEAQALKATCGAITRIAADHIVLVTSEINRDYYRNHEQALELSPLAAFVGSRSIEYMLMLGIVLLTPPKPAEHVLARVAKNKIGFGEPDFAIAFDRTRATAHEVPLPEPERGGLADSNQETPSIDLQRLIWNTVRDSNNDCNSHRKIKKIIERTGHKVSNSQFEDALAELDLDNLVKRAPDGRYYTQTWTRP